jgi:GNAT superfamily N-acetyltransferase
MVRDHDGPERTGGVRRRRARYALLDGEKRGCEFAVAADDAWKGSGLAGVLMHALMRFARQRGIKAMEGTGLATNIVMLKFMRQLGFRREPVEGDARVACVPRDLRSPRSRARSAAPRRPAWIRGLRRRIRWG